VTAIPFVFFLAQEGEEIICWLFKRRKMFLHHFSFLGEKGYGF
jgi:hypothetical protein